MTVEARVRPQGPYSLALTARGGSDATRMLRDGVLTAALRVGDRVEVGAAAQASDGTVLLRASSEEAIERLRFVLAVDDDHTAFVRRFADDPLLGETVRRLRGMRELRLPTVAHALLRAFCGQLIESRRAWSLECRIVRALTPVVPESRLHAPPTAACLARRSAAELRALGLHARRSAALIRLCRSFDPERLHALPTEVAAERLERERGLGPWSAGLVCLQGLGRFERGLVGDLGLIKLASALRERWVDAAETAELLAPYGEWAGLASRYLLKGFALGLIPLPESARRRPPRFRFAAAST